MLLLEVERREEGREGQLRFWRNISKFQPPAELVPFGKEPSRLRRKGQAERREEGELDSGEELQNNPL